MEATVKLDNGTTVKAVLWQKQGKCRIYISTISTWGRETGAGSFELVRGKWTTNGEAADVAKRAWGNGRAMLDALMFVGNQPPQATVLSNGGGRRYERIDLDAEPGDPGHICG